MARLAACMRLQGIFLAACILLVGGYAVATVKGAQLFGPFVYGMSKSEVEKSINCAPCPDAPRNALCALEPVEFIERQWRQRFNFNNFDELQEISLSGGDNPREIAQAMRKAGWEPAFLESDDAALDLLAEAGKADPGEAARQEAEFEENALQNNASLTVYFFRKDSARRNAGKTYFQAIEQASEKLRLAALMANGENLLLSFTTPALSRKSALRYGSMIKKN